MTLEQLIRDLANSKLGGENEWYSWREISNTDLPKDVSLPPATSMHGMLL